MPYRRAPSKHAPDVAQLEDRVMLSAAPVANVLPGAGGLPDADPSTAAPERILTLEHDVTAVDEGRGFDADASDELARRFQVESSTDPQADVRRELVLMDTSVDDYEQLVDDLSAGGDETRNIEVFLLDADRDGIDQISEILAGYDDLDAVHIVSHGTDGAVKLGNLWLRLENVGGYAGQLVGWRDALASEADLLFYGCDLAESEDGQALVESLSTLTGADVAASTDDTGNALFGGDWRLEYSVGRIETAVAFGAEARQDWMGLLAVLTVDTTSDLSDGDTSSIVSLIGSPGADGFISLREAILATNNTANGATPDEIHFDISTADSGYVDPDTIPGSGDEYWTITPTSFLGWITDPVILDAATQPGYSGNPVIELDGSSVAGATTIIGLQTNDSLVRGFAIHSSSDEAIEIDGAGGLGQNNTIQGNWIGIDAEGNVNPNTEHGIILVSGASNNLIGGSGPNEGNVIAGNNYSGIFIRDSGTNDNTVCGNVIGLLPDGVTPAPNGRHGIELGTAVADNVIGGIDAGEGNVIAHNTLSGVGVSNDAGNGNSIRGNSIHSNAQIGIDLNADGVTANDSGDGDSGPNDLQNFPVLTSVETSGSEIQLNGSLNSTPTSTFRIEFFASAAADPSGYGEAERYLGYTDVTTDGLGNVTLPETLPFSVAAGEYVTATATDSNGNTSEFGQSVVALAAVNDPPTVSLENTTNTLSEDTDTTARIKVADVVITDDGLGANDLALSGADAGMFEIDGTELYLSAGATLDFETNPVLDVTVEVDDTTVGAAPDDTAALAITVTDANDPPTVSLQNTTNTLSEDTDTTARIKVADIVITDDALGTNDLALSGADTGMFEIDGTELYLSAGATLDFETNPVLDVTVEVDDTTVGAAPDDTAALAITVTDANDPPTVNLQNTTNTLSEDTDTTVRIKVADIVITDDALGTSDLALSGADAGMFEIDGTELYLSAGAMLDFETNPLLDVTVEVDDTTVGATPDDTAALAIAVTDANDPPTVSLENTTTTLSEGTDTTVRIKVADIVITDDGLGTNDLALSGVDAGMFEIDGTELYLSAGATLDFETNPVLDVTVEVDDTTVGATPDDTAALAVTVTDANEPPTVSLQNTTNTLPEDTDTTARIKVADIVITDDALGANDLALSGADAGMFEIDGTELYLSAGATLDFETNPVLDVTVEVDDTTVGATPDDTAALAITVTDANDPPTVSLQNTTNTLSEDTDTTVRIKVADIVITDDALGTNDLALSGADAGMFEIDGTELYLSTGATLDFETNPVLDVTVEVDDTTVGATPDDMAALTITVTDANDPPTVSPATFALDENSPVGTNLGTVSATDPDAGDSLTYSITSGNTGGAFAIDNATGMITVANPAALDYETTPTFNLTVQVEDLGGLIDTALVTINLNPLNDNAPIAVADSATVVEGGAVTALDSGEASVLANDSDADVPADALSAVLESGPGFAASFTLNSDGTFLYVHDGSENFADTFTYHVSDGTNTSDPVTVTINILPTNDAPVATDDAYSVNEDSTLTVAAPAGVLANDVDADGDPLSASLTSGPTDGTLTLNADGSFTYTPDADFHGSDSFTYQVRDPSGASDTATVSITVDSVNDAPVAAGEDYAVKSDETLSVGAPGLAANDTDVEADPLTVVLVSGPTEGTLSVSPDGSFTYTPDPNSDGVVSFSYLVSDGSADSDVVTVTIDVQGAFGPPAQPPDGGEPPPDDGNPPPEEDTDTNDETDDQSVASPDVRPPSDRVIVPHRGTRSESSTEQPAVSVQVLAPITSSDQADELAGIPYSRMIDDYIPHCIQQAVRTFQHVVGPVGGYIDPTALWDVLDDFQSEVMGDRNSVTYMAGSVAMVSLTLTAGYVFWTVKGGYLLASVMSSLPAWRFMDPLPILDAGLAADSGARSSGVRTADRDEDTIV